MGLIKPRRLALEELGALEVEVFLDHRRDVGKVEVLLFVKNGAIPAWQTEHRAKPRGCNS